MGEDIRAWGQRAKMELADLRAYGQAVYTSVDSGLAALSNDDVERQLDLSAMGLGEKPVSWAYM